MSISRVRRFAKPDPATDGPGGESDPAVSSAPSETGLRPPQLPRPAADMDGMSILIVDDDEITRLSLAHILETVAPTTQAVDGEQAWEMLLQGPAPDLCCCDIRMPRLDGLELMARARAHPLFEDLPFVLISSASDRRTVQSAIAGGAAGYILKPFLAVQTRTSVRGVLRERRTAEAESVAATRRRLNASPEALCQLLNVLRSDALACSEALRAGDEPAGQADRLQRLRSGSVVLGLRRCTTLLKRLPRANAAEVAALVGEVVRLVERQLNELEHAFPGSCVELA